MRDCGAAQSAIPADLHNILVLPDESLIIVDLSSSLVGLDVQTVNAFKEPQRAVFLFRLRCCALLHADVMTIIDSPDYLLSKPEWEKELDQQDEEEQMKWDRLREEREAQSDYESSDD